MITEDINTVVIDSAKSFSSIASPIPSMLFFITITSIFAILMISLIYSENNLDKLSEMSNNNTYNLIYIGILLIGSFFININISKTLCNNSEINWGNILFLTLLPWILIFGLLYLLLEIFTGWVNPFSNTFGYLIVNFLGAGKILEELLKHTPSTGSDSNSTNLVYAINNIKKNHSKIINEFDHKQANFEEQFNQFIRAKIFHDIKDNENRNKLYQHIISKFLIGKLIWYILAGILISSITYNFILNTNCSKSNEQQKNEYDSLNNQYTYNPIYGTNWKQITDENEIEQLIVHNDSNPGQFGGLIQNYSNKFLTSIDNIEFTKHDLRQVDLSRELPKNICIEIDGNYYIPTA